MSHPESPSDEHVDLDSERIIETLNRHDVDYILVGGLGAAAHGATRITYDFDALARREPGNLDRLADAMNELGARYRAENLPDELAKQITPPLDRRNFSVAAMSTWRTDAGDLDILTELPVASNRGLSYDDAAIGAIDARIGDTTIQLAALDDIIASKRHANRGKDQAALPELDRLARRQKRDLDVDDGFDIS